MWFAQPLNRGLTWLVPRLPDALVRRVAAPYLAGESRVDALDLLKSLAARGIRGALNYLGEEVENPEQAEAALNEYLQVLDAVASLGADAYASMKPSQLGLRPRGVGMEGCIERCLHLARRAARDGLFLRLEMEDATYTDATLELWRRVHCEYANVGLVLQARLFRSAADAATLMTAAAAVRLCKGIYIEPRDIAYTRDADIRASYLRLAERLMEGNGFLAFATHDDWLVERLLERLTERAFPAERYEFQLLLGVRPHLIGELLRRGQPLRLYLPYGPWSQARAYAQRRMRKNPALAYHLLKNTLLSGGARA
ncbi:MAG: proline dehydrogenase family protein [Candidatus Tectomicrobia bacterium]|nr:proline dehydrogenase family protein [Candidatus Tectomicrobia bacterium]